MAYEYDKNIWEGFNEDFSVDIQPNAVITHEKLNTIERGIERASMTLEPGNITMSETSQPSVSVTVDEISHTRKINIAFPKVEVASGADIKDNVQSDTSTWSSNKINSKLNELEEKLLDLTYEPIVINNFTSSVNVIEFGDKLNSITFNWSLNKTPVSLKINNNDLDINARTTKIVEEITTNKTYELKAIDEKDAVASSIINIKFVNGIYYGKSIKRTIDDLTSSYIMSNFSKVLSNSLSRTFNVNAGENEHIYYIYPSRLGDCSFFVGGFEGGFDLLGTINFTNSYDYTEEYKIYVSVNSGLGDTSVTCK